MTATITQHRAKLYLTGDLAVEFTIFDHGGSQVPQEAWDAFVAGYRHAHGSFPAATLAEYVTDETWRWDGTYGEDTVVIGDADSPLALEAGADSPAGCRIVFWDGGDVFDTGLRVWEPEAEIISRLLREKAEAEA